MLDWPGHVLVGFIHKPFTSLSHKPSSHCDFIHTHCWFYSGSPAHHELSLVHKLTCCTWTLNITRASLTLSVRTHTDWVVKSSYSFIALEALMSSHLKVSSCSCSSCVCSCRCLRPAGLFRSSMESDWLSLSINTWFSASRLLFSSWRAATWQTHAKRDRETSDVLTPSFIYHMTQRSDVSPADRAVVSLSAN